MKEETGREILEEIRRQGQFNKRAVFGSLVILAMAVAASLFLVPHLVQKTHKTGDTGPEKASTPFSWRDVATSIDKGDYEEALSIAKELTEKAPHYWYGYSYIGSIFQAMGDLDKSEKFLAKAYALFPIEDN